MIINCSSCAYSVLLQESQVNMLYSFVCIRTDKRVHPYHKCSVYREGQPGKPVQLSIDEDLSR